MSLPRVNCQSRQDLRVFRLGMINLQTRVDDDQRNGRLQESLTSIGQDENLGAGVVTRLSC